MSIAVIDILQGAFDRLTHSMKSINSDHNAIHIGQGFCLGLYHASLVTTGKKIYRISSPAIKYAHIKSIQVSVAGSTCTAKLIRGTTASPLVITNAGTEITNAISNLNDNSTTVNTLKVYDGTVEYTGGAVWCSVIAHADTAGSGGNQSIGSGQFVQSDYLEYVTKTGNADYILEIENIGADTAVQIKTDIFFYEEPKGLI